MWPSSLRTTLLALHLHRKQSRNLPSGSTGDATLAQHMFVYHLRSCKTTTVEAQPRHAIYNQSPDEPMRMNQNVLSQNGYGCQDDEERVDCEDNVVTQPGRDATVLPRERWGEYICSDGLIDEYTVMGDDASESSRVGAATPSQLARCASPRAACDEDAIPVAAKRAKKGKRARARARLCSRCCYGEHAPAACDQLDDDGGCALCGDQHFARDCLYA